MVFDMQWNIKILIQKKEELLQLFLIKLRYLLRDWIPSCQIFISAFEEAPYTFGHLLMQMQLTIMQLKETKGETEAAYCNAHPLILLWFLQIKTEKTFLHFYSHSLSQKQFRDSWSQLLMEYLGKDMHFPSQ